MTPAFDASAWENAEELGVIDAAPWRLGGRFAAAMSFAGHPVRAVYLTSDALMSALGRPNREQVVTQRASTATTLQAVELTNGATLQEILTRGARNLLHGGVEGQGLFHGLFQHALSRAPTAAELDIATEVIGDPPSQDGLADMLWTLVMLPEFQLIR